MDHELGPRGSPFCASAGNAGDKRSDIYSPGVLLYELLAGSTPFDAKDLMSQGIDAMRKTIREKEPVRPSTKLTQELVAADVSPRKSTAELAVPTPEEVSTDSRRRLRLKEQIARVRGDLDWIVMKCLEKDRTRRYGTANGLAFDLKRHLNNEPVLARPPSRLYEFQKTVRRHKFGFAAAAALVAVLSFGVLTSTWQAVLATRAKREAQGTGFQGAWFSPDGNAIVWGNQTAPYLWRAPSWEEINAAESKERAEVRRP